MQLRHRAATSIACARSRVGGRERVGKLARQGDARVDVGEGLAITVACGGAGGAGGTPVTVDSVARQRP